VVKKNQETQTEINCFYESLREILYFKGEDKNIDFFISSITEFNPFYTTEDINEWLSAMNKTQYFSVSRIPIDKLDKWEKDSDTGDINHVSNGFFSMRGLQVKTNWGDIPAWSQPIIHQPEIGILGIITKKINGILYFLLQAKAEPGNINTYQLSPTVQATRSNYLQLHGGKPTLYLEYFINYNKAITLVDQLQSEQGARFFQKRNRNIIIRLKDNCNIKVHKNFRWFTLGQILKLVQINNTVNMDTRSVISAISYEPGSIIKKSPINTKKLDNCISNFPLISNSKSKLASKLMVSSHPNSKGLYTIDELLIIITQRKFEYQIESNLIPLNQVQDWIQTPEEIYNKNRKYFSVIGVHIEANNREVASWDQPIIKQVNPGIVGFIIKEINGVMHVLTQLKLECGVMDILEISPTVQCLTLNYKEIKVPYLNEMLERKGLKEITDSFQSEEGGRFYQESNQNIVLEANESFELVENENFIWMTFGQLKHFMKFNNLLNVEARSLLACIHNN